jgi:hypothetical protein
LNQIVIENPIANPPFDVRQGDFLFFDKGITKKTDRGHRSFWPREKAWNRLHYNPARAQERIEVTKLIDIRWRGGRWHKGGCTRVSPTVGRFIAYWVEEAWLSLYA